MRVDLKLRDPYDALLFLAESSRNPPLLCSHRHDELEINLVVKGQVTYVVDGRRIILERRSLVWFFPHQEHQLVFRSPDASYFVAAFTPRLIKRACRSSAYADLTSGVSGGFRLSELTPVSFDLMRRLMASLTQDGLDTDLLNRELGFGSNSDFRFSHGDPDRLNAGLQYLLLACWQHHQRGTSSGSVALHPAVKRTLAILEDAEDDIGLARLAKLNDLSPAYLSRVFHQQIGMPLNRYRSAQRLARFRELIARPNKPSLLDAALAAGFGSYAQFHRTFLQEYHCGPRQYLSAREASNRTIGPSPSVVQKIQK